MEIDELKAAWQTLDRRLDQQNRINLRMYAEQRVNKAKSRLRPLIFGQLMQILSGIVLVVLGVSVWSSHRDVPELLASGIIVHAYGVLTIICAGITLSLISRVDPAEPVVAIQKRLGRLRDFYVRSSMALGLAWWLLWVPFAVCFFHWLAGVNFVRLAPSVVAVALAGGVVGLLATWLFHRWASNPKRPRLSRFIRDGMTGASLRKARHELDELERFERE